MSDFWTPEKTPPQVSEDARLTVLEMILSEGVQPVSQAALARLQDGDEPLAEYLDRFGFDLNCITDEGLWPERIVKMGAALAMKAYRETGYFQTIDEEAFAAGGLAARLDGIPEAYLTSCFGDAELQSLVSAAVEAPVFHGDEGGYAQILTIGAGCTRHYMQHALAAAA